MLQHAHYCLNQHTAEGSCVSHCSQPVCATDSSIISYSSLPSPSTPPLPHLLSFSSLSYLLFCPSSSSPPPPSPLLSSLFHPFPLHLPPLLLSLLLSLLLTLSSFVSSSPFLPHLFTLSPSPLHPLSLTSLPSLPHLFTLSPSPLHPLSLTSQLSLCSPQMPQEVLMSVFSFEIN